MKSIPRIHYCAFTALCFIILLSSIISLAKAVAWIGDSFPGFLLYDAPYVGSFSSRDWPGKMAGLHYLDRILTVDGKAVRSGQEVVEDARLKQPGTLVCYTARKQGKIEEIFVAVAQFTLKDFILVFFPTFFMGLTIYILGVIVYLLKPNTRTSWVFLVMCFGLGIYGITGFEIQSTYSFVRLHYLCASLFPACFIHFGLIFPERKEILARIPVLEYLIYVPFVLECLGFQIYTSALPGVLEGNETGLIPSLEFLSSFLRLFTLFGFVSLITLVVHCYLKSTITQVRQRAKIIIFGVTIAFVPPAILTVGALAFSVYFPFNFIPFFVVFFPIAVAYSIVRHNLFDADIIIRRTVGYALVTSIVVSAYAVISLGLNVLVGHYEMAQSQAFPILFTLSVILIFNPLRNRIQSLVDRVFFRKEYDYGAIVEKVSAAMTSLLDLGAILRRLVQAFTEDMFINTSSVMLLAPAGNAYQVYLADGEKRQDVERIIFQREGPLLGIVEQEKRELTKYDLLEDPRYKEVCEECERNFDALHATLMVPMVFQDKVIGLMNLGEKKSGKFYNREDIDLLRTLAHQGAVAIENARLFQENLEKQRMEEELNIARDLQMSMLPSSCPEIRGFEIAASSTPAREVGGDFYDFIEMGEDKAGLVIGDVTGKSVSGALVMSSSRSVFRMLSEENLTVGDIMVRANRRIKKDIRSGMFVALLYAVLNAKDGTVSLCSAGQTQPIHFSFSTGEAVLVETQGDNFPLGILDEADYQETSLHLARGDMIVFYTDGIVEAMNDKREMFGFERLQEVIRSTRFTSADDMHREILGKVAEFVSGAAQHDDLTVIVIHVTTQEAAGA